MDVKKLFDGIVVIIDNEIGDKESSIFSIKRIIENCNIPVATYEDIPNIEVVSALSNAAFIILDWDYFNSSFTEELSEDRIMIPAELTENKEQELIRFITKVINDIFLPVFIFTAINSDSIKDKLRSERLWEDNKANRIFVKQKSEISSEEELFSAINNWLKEMPSAYVLKTWNQSFTDAKNKLFLAMYGCSPNWVKIIWDMLKSDSTENQHEFGAFVTKNLINRISEMDFNEEYLESDKKISQEELLKVMEGERFITYKEQPTQAYTGDLFFKENKYYLNIRAQCDLSRRSNPTLYCLKGQILPDTEIVTEDIQLTTEGTLKFSAERHFSLEQLGEICKTKDRLDDFNSNFEKHRKSRFFSDGVILERGPEVIISCIAGEKAIKFRMDLKVVEFNKLKANRVGRILPPYITRIQQRCSQHIVREGTMPIPKDLFTDFEEQNPKQKIVD